MKKLLLLTFILTTNSYMLTAQNQPQLPNGDFENWASFTPCSGIDSVTNYKTYDQYHYYEHLKYSVSPYCPSVASTYKVTDKQHGNYALKLIPLKIATGVYEPNAFVSSDPSLFVSDALPFTGRPTKLVGYYKFTKMGNDEAEIQISTAQSGGSPIAFGNFSITTGVSVYTKFEIPLSYFTTINPDILILLIRVGDFPNESGSLGTELYLDNLSFEYGSVTSTTTYQSTSSINVFAANKNINFSENVSDVHVVDMTGASKMQETANTQQLNVASLKSGLYVVTYKYNDNYFSKKIVLE